MGLVTETLEEKRAQMIPRAVDDRRRVDALEGVDYETAAPNLLLVVFRFPISGIHRKGGSRRNARSLGLILV
jgi:hypothetical protein